MVEAAKVLKRRKSAISGGDYPMWLQNYDPFGWPLVSTIMAAAPIVVLLGLLVAGRSAPMSAGVGLLTALAVAILGMGMPVDAACAAAGYGALYGLMPIGWIVLSAVFLFQLTVKSGQFEVVKQSVASLSADRRMQALLIAFCFGSFIEGAAGFGTPVAVSAALLIGLGFTPLYAAGLSLVANTSPVAFGALGTPIIMLAKVSGLDEMELSQMAGRQLPFFSLIVPAWLVAVMSGWRGVVACLPAIAVCGGTFAVVQFLTSNLHGPTLVDVAGGLAAMLALAVLLRVWQPKDRFECTDVAAANRRPDSSLADNIPTTPLTAGRIAYAWMPWVLLSIMVFTWGWPAVKVALNGGTAEAPNALSGISKLSWEVPRLHQQVARVSPVVPEVSPENAVYDFNWLSTTGTSIFLAAVLTGVWLRVSPGAFVRLFGHTVWSMRAALITIACMLALAFVTKYSGTDATLGLAFTRTGWLYPFFAPLLGWLGVALTGSDTSSNALFGSLQRITAEQLDLSPTLIVASNSTGGVMGKMIDAQSIVVAAVATGQHGGEGRILRFVFWHSVALAVGMGLLTLLQAYVWTSAVPG
jgi:lactate permease